MSELKNSEHYQKIKFSEAVKIQENFEALNLKQIQDGRYS